MKTTATFFFQIFSNAIAILAAAQFIPGFHFVYNFRDLIITSAVFTAINLFVKPLLKVILTPIIIITFGLLIIFINALTLRILDIIIEPLTIQGYIPLFLATLVIGIINVLINAGAKIRYRESTT